MAASSLMRVGLRIQDRILDLQIPRQMTLANLAAQLPEVLAGLRITLPNHFDLQITNKDLQVNLQVALGDYPISDGDQLQVMTHEV